MASNLSIHLHHFPYEIRQALFDAIIDVYFAEKPGCRELVYLLQGESANSGNSIGRHDYLYWSTGFGIKDKDKPAVELVLNECTKFPHHHEEFRAARIRKSNVAFCVGFIGRTLRFMEPDCVPDYVLKHATTVKIVLPERFIFPRSMLPAYDAQFTRVYAQVFEAVCHSPQERRSLLMHGRHFSSLTNLHI